ncbi:hypothetical protein NESM_000308700 [Novymonas esmeraldas]|uniref:Serine aminopeptidase S33 domain-containing protein n=1 Tax=Novymonas esmeraldas TaxID=1808958 RepID=A0AAW0EKJ4_9TRYP
MNCAAIVFFLVHCLLHCFAYWLPRAVASLVGLILCRPCRDHARRRHGYTYHSPHEVRLVHHADLTEAAVEVFGLMDVAASAREDRQYCFSAVVEAHTTGVAAPLQQQQQQGSAVPETHTAGWHRSAAEKVLALLETVCDGRLFTIKSGGLSSSSPDSTGHIAVDADATAVSPREPMAESWSGTPPSSSSSSPSPAAVTDAQAESAAVAAPHAPPRYRPPSGPARRQIRECGLHYDAPLYGPHVGTIMGALRPSTPIPYTREEMTAWDGCRLAMDWWYVQGEAPRDHDHERVACKAAAASALHEPARVPPAPHDADEGAEIEAGRERPQQRQELEQATSAATEVSVPLVPTAAASASAPRARGVVFLLPGLSSFSQTPYVRHFVRAMHAADFHVCVLNTRGMGDTPPVTTRFLFNGAYTRDTRDCLQQHFAKAALQRRFGRPLPVIGVGLSIGGATLSKYIGEEGIAGADPLLDSAICCCSPIDFVAMVEHMNRDYAQRLVYQPDMCNDVRTYIMRHPPLQDMPNVDRDWVFEQGNIHRFHRVLHFDEHVIAPSAGYRSAHHYHIDASAITWLPYAPVPVLVVSAADDPVIGRTVMAHRWREVVRNNPRVVYAEAPVGGHLGFLGGPVEELCEKENWLERFVRDRATAACEYWHRVQRATARSHASRHATTAAPPGLYSPTTTEASAASPAPPCLMRRLTSSSSCSSDDDHDDSTDAITASDTRAAPTAALPSSSVGAVAATTAAAAAAVGLSVTGDGVAQTRAADDAVVFTPPRSGISAHGESHGRPIDEPRWSGHAPPPEGRTTNACYFSDHRLPAASPPQLSRLFFSASRTGALSSGSPATAVSGGPLLCGGKDPRCTAAARCHRYAAVVVNCDYLADPRAMMQVD